MKINGSVITLENDFLIQFLNANKSNQLLLNSYEHVLEEMCKTSIFYNENSKKLSNGDIDLSKINKDFFKFFQTLKLLSEIELKEDLSNIEEFIKSIGKERMIRFISKNKDDSKFRQDFIILNNYIDKIF